MAGADRHVAASCGEAGRGRRSKASPGLERFGKDRQAWDGVAKTRLAGAGLGMAGVVRQGTDKVCHGLAGEEGRSVAGCGKSRTGRRGLEGAGSGEACCGGRGRQGDSGTGKPRQGLARRDAAGAAWIGVQGKA